MNWIPFFEAMYIMFLGRPADKDGLNFYVAQVESGTAPQLIAASISASPEAGRYLQVLTPFRQAVLR